MQLLSRFLIASLLAFLCLFFAGSSGCGKRVAQVSGIVSTGAAMVEQHIGKLALTGRVSPELIARLEAFASETRAFASDFKRDMQGYDSLSPRDKRALLLRHASRLEAAITSLEASGAIRFDDPEHERTFERAMTGARSALLGLRLASELLPRD